MSSSNSTSQAATFALGAVTGVIVCWILPKLQGLKAKKGTSLTEKYARPNILTLQPYRCARDDYSTGLLLDANENTLGPSLSTPSSNILERYPSPYQIPLKKKLSKIRSISVENIFVGVGSDEAIDMLYRIFCVPGVSNVITTPPTYGMYKVCAVTNDVKIKEVPLDSSYNLRVPEMLRAVDSNTRIIWICSPGNPTSHSISETQIRLIASNFPGIVVVDEAYVDFAVDGSMCKLLKEFDNVVVLQTLSKAFGLAGIRCGFALASEEIIELMNRVKAPYNLNKLSSIIAQDALDNYPSLQEKIKSVIKERERVAKVLDSKDYVVRVQPSDANFLLFQLTSKAKEVYQSMADDFAVVTRYRGTEKHCNECIRVTVGRIEENEEFLKALDGAWEKVNGSVSL
ncbi:hypothetical protein TrLO_g14830 [Triparma laevis f. longispina]|uniref:histidinol-phosphate transaminase n=2 Tax=Triparma laevis TaxID=1534972 RepID=A0A9W7FTK1_9STRA|nr:hypothetical protein TrLO_g14830 [Triparma laevis f. longispina]